MFDEMRCYDEKLKDFFLDEPKLKNDEKDDEI